MRNQTFLFRTAIPRDVGVDHLQEILAKIPPLGVGVVVHVQLVQQLTEPITLRHLDGLETERLPSGAAPADDFVDVEPQLPPVPRALLRLPPHQLTHQQVHLAGDADVVVVPGPVRVLPVLGGRVDVLPQVVEHLAHPLRVVRDEAAVGGLQPQLQQQRHLHVARPQPQQHVLAQLRPLLPVQHPPEAAREVLHLDELQLGVGPGDVPEDRLQVALRHLQHVRGEGQLPLEHHRYQIPQLVHADGVQAHDGRLGHVFDDVPDLLVGVNRLRFHEVGDQVDGEEDRRYLVQDWKEVLVKVQAESLNCNRWREYYRDCVTLQH